MIADFVLNLYLDIYYELMTNVPYAVFPDGWLDVFATVQSTLSQLQTVFPVDVGLYMMEIVIFIETAVLVFKVGNSLLTKIWGS